LLGKERKIAYRTRKYHSGIIWTGVTKGLAKDWLTQLPSISGSKNNKIEMEENNKKRTKKSLYRMGRNEVIIELEEKGLKLVNEWRTNKWIAIKRPITKAKVKWIIKKRFKT